MKNLLQFTILMIFLLVSCTDEKDNYEEIETDLLIIGGGASGTMAGIQAARLGVKTLIIEETPWLGGMLTAAGVSATDGNHRLPSGLWAEFRQRLYDHYGGPDAVSTGWVSNTLFEPHVGDSIFKAMAKAEPDLSILYNSTFMSVDMQGSKVDGIMIRDNNTGKESMISAMIVIDATELGDVSAAAGVNYDIGMESRAVTGEECAPDKSNDIIQDLTYVAILKDYGPDADKTIPKPADYNANKFNCSCSDFCDDDSTEVVNCVQMLEYGRLPNNKFMINWPIVGNDYYVNPIEMDQNDRLAAYEKAKAFTYEFIYYIQTELGFKNLGIADDEFPTEDNMPLIPYHRESRRIHGLVRFTVNDVLEPYTHSQVYKTSVVVGDYPVDHHHGRNPVAPEIDFPQVPAFSIPLGCLVPQQVDGLIVAEKSISVSNIINGSTRLQPIVLLIGQAAGALAVHCLQNDIQPSQADIRAVQEALLDADSYLLPFIDISPDDAYFKSIQKMGVCGLLKGHGVPYKWANQMWIYPDSLLTVDVFEEALNEIQPDFELVSDREEKPFITMSALIEQLAVFAEQIKSSNPSFSSLDLSVFNEEYLRNHSDQWKLLNSMTDNARRRDFAVIVDHTLQPFERMGVDFQGDWVDSR
jgi:hypothetical protein